MLRTLSSCRAAVASAMAATDGPTGNIRHTAKRHCRGAALLAALGLAGAITSAEAAQLTLNWTDNADNETGFHIERSTDGSSYTQIASVAADTVTYTDTGLVASTAYWYRVRAYNSAGESNYSNIASAATSANLLDNGDFELFENGTALGWTAQSAGGVALALSEEAGQAGQAQKISITTTSAWGMFFFQQPAMVPGKTYAWTFWYRTDGPGMTASVSNAAHSAFIFDMSLPGTDGTWQQATKIFTYDNADADQVRVAASAQGSYWIDSMTLVETEPPAPTNTAPTVGQISSQTINEDGTTGTVAFAVDDAESSASSLIVTGISSNAALIPNGNIVFGGSGGSRTVTVTPAAHQSGTAAITVTVSDGELTATDTFSVTVAAVNDAPTVSAITNQSISEDGSTGSIAFTVSDIETASSSLAVTGSSSDIELIPNDNIVFGGSGSNRAVTVSPTAGESGSATITVTVSDGQLTSSVTFTVNVSAVNDAPTISGIADQAISEDGATGPIAFTVNDAETPAGSLTITTGSSDLTLMPPANISLEGSGSNRTIAVAPAADQNGTATITVVVSDGSLSASTSFDVTVAAVNDAPAISDISNRTIADNESTGAMAFTVGDAETPAGALAVSGSSSDTALIPNGNIVFGGSGSNRTVTVSPAEDETGSAVITVSVSDGELSASDTFTVTVTANNTAPTISSMANQTIDEDESTGAVAFSIDDGETPAGGLTVTGASSNLALVPTAGIVFGGTDTTRTVTVTPAENQSGTATITVLVSDGALTDSTSFSVDVASVNDTPTIGAIPNQEVSAGDTTGVIAFTVNDVETAADSLTVTATSSNPTLVPENKIVFGGSGPDRTITVSPAVEQTGATEVIITVTVSDGVLSANRTFAVTYQEIASSLFDYELSDGSTITLTPQDIGAVGNAGATTYNAAANEISVTAGGQNILGTSDGFHFVWHRMTGDFAVVARVASLAQSHPWAKAGLMIRESLEPGSVHAMAATSAANGLVFYRRPANGANTVTTEGPSAGAPVWIKLERRGDEISAHSSVSGTDWAPYASETLDFGATVYVGLAVTARSTTKTTTATFSDLDFQTLTPPLPAYEGPRYFFGDVGSDQSGKFGLLVREDDTGLFLAAISGRAEPIEVDGFTISDSGAFTFSIPDLGTVSGQITDDTVSGSISGPGLGFAGTQEPISGATETLAGYYRAVMLNTSNGRVLILAGPDGRALVLTEWDGATEAALTPLAPDGTIETSTPSGLALTLTANSATGTLSGSMSSSSGTHAVTGVRENVVTTDRLVNTSVRAQVEQGAGIMIAGFFVRGDGTKQVLIRGIGPALTNLGVSGALADPMLAVYRQNSGSDATLIAENDDWEQVDDAAGLTAATERVFAFPLPTGGKDAALALDLPAGAYTAHVSSVSDTVGAALVEVYDAGAASDTAQLSNISLRGEVGSGEDTVISGFVVNGETAKRLLIRAVGSELQKFGVPGTLSNPTLTIYHRTNGTDAIIASNDDWDVDAATVSTAAAQVGAFALDAGSGSAAMVLWLEPGIYTAHAASNDGSSGIALIEVYEAQ